jgi:heat shock protein HslJ
MSDSLGSNGAPATSDALAGSAWVIASIDGQPVSGIDLVSVVFGHDGRVTGSTGMNRFTASYSLSAAYLTIGPMATTRRGGQQQQAAQEQRVVAALAGMCSFELRGSHLAIEGPMGWVELERTDDERSAVTSVDGTGSAPHE